MCSSSSSVLTEWNRFHVVKTLGTGSYGTVYLCRDVEPSSEYFEEHVAVKTVPLAAINDKESHLAMSEVAILRNLSHPNILTWIDVFIDRDQQLCCVTEYVDGGDLACLVKQAKKRKRYLDSFVVVDLIRQVLEGMAYLHHEAVLHRDIKPANIMLTSHGTVKIGDFGVSKLLSDAMPQAVTFIGTPFYICPELCMGEPYSFSADVWALGVSAYELYCLKLPFFASNVLALANTISEGQYDRALLHHRPLPPEQLAEMHVIHGEGYTQQCQSLDALAAGLIESMLTVDPSRRPSAQWLLQTYFGVETDAPHQSVFYSSVVLGKNDDGDDAIADGSAMSPDVGVTGMGIDGRSPAATTSVRSMPPSPFLSTPGALQRIELRPELSAPSDDGNGCGEGEDHDQTTLVITSMGNVRRSSDMSVVASSQQIHHNDDTVLTDDGREAVDDAAREERPGWARSSAIYRDPQALERMLREKALVYHRKRHAMLKALREEHAKSNHEASSNAQSHTASSTEPPYCYATALQGGALVITPSIRSMTRALVRESHTSGIGMLSEPQALQFTPARVHFSDDEVDPGEGGESDNEAELTVVILRLDQQRVTLSKPIELGETSLKTLQKRVLSAVTRAVNKKIRIQTSTQAHADSDADGEVSDSVCSLPESALSLIFAYEDADGDFVSFCTSKEWKAVMKDHSKRCRDGEDVPTRMIVRVDW